MRISSTMEKLNMSFKISELIARHPQLERWHIGDSCVALRLNLENSGYYLLITDDDDYAPQDGVESVWCGIYDSHDEQIGDVVGVQGDIAPLSDRIQRTIDAARSLPGSVREYFVSRLGQSSNLVFDMALCPLDSNVGDDCKKVIDSTTELFDSLHAAWGKNSEEEEEVRRIVADICNVFWRG